MDTRAETLHGLRAERLPQRRERSSRCPYRAGGTRFVRRSGEEGCGVTRPAYFFGLACAGWPLTAR